MDIKAVYINTYKYDFQFARICIASVRYWYPLIPIFLIKDYGSGAFDTKIAERKWNVQTYNTNRKNFGWGFGKLEPLFSDTPHSFLILDADTVLSGPVINNAKGINTPFLVDEEFQLTKRFNEIYYNLDRINEIEPEFHYPGYSFNSGQWFGTSGILTRQDFEKILQWSEPPTPFFPDLIYNGEQGHLNFILHWKEQRGAFSISRKKIMIWPQGINADFLDLHKIRNKFSDYPFIIHWAGMKTSKMTSLPRADILRFYRDFYYSKAGWLQSIIDHIENFYYNLEIMTKRWYVKIKKII